MDARNQTTITITNSTKRLLMDLQAQWSLSSADEAIRRALEHAVVLQPLVPEDTDPPFSEPKPITNQTSERTRGAMGKISYERMVQLACKEGKPDSIIAELTGLPLSRVKYLRHSPHPTL